MYTVKLGSKAKGFVDEAIAKVEKALPTAFDIKFAFNKWTLGEAFCHDTLGISSEEMAAPSFDLLARIGFTKREIDAANIHVCGAMTVEGAPHLKAEHYPVFDCANPCGRTGKRYLSVESHIRPVESMSIVAISLFGREIATAVGRALQSW